MSGQGSGGEGQSGTQLRADQDIPQPRDVNREAEGLHEPYVCLGNSTFRYSAHQSIYLGSPSNGNKNNDHGSVCLACSPLPLADRILALRRRRVVRTEMRRLSILTRR